MLLTDMLRLKAMATAVGSPRINNGNQCAKCGGNHEELLPHHPIYLKSLERQHTKISEKQPPLQFHRFHDEMIVTVITCETSRDGNTHFWILIGYVYRDAPMIERISLPPIKAT
mmetsp:Transcript_34450/g.51400  ORF Transcript_34450/g.51400 Transcript_34450/m.51400 type:complete len:114 (-) Transcript_34450:1881-2222(-)